MKSFSPTNLYYLISFACNERCTKCHHWAIRPAFTPLDSSLVAHAINSLPDLTEFCIVGGEPLLFRDRIISLLTAIKNHPCRTVLITNGVLMDAAFIDRISRLKIHIVVSIDTVDRKHWQFVRGRDTMDIVLGNLRYARNVLRPDQLSIQSVLAQETKKYLADVRALADELGVYHSIQDYMAEGFGGEWTAMPAHEKRVPENEICHAAGRNLSVLPNGDVFTCFQQSWMPGCQKPLGNLTRDQIAGMISNEYATGVQAAMRQCNLPCKVLKCNQRN
jgi:sulfatase maturation enzyme AslB (radical SAM superfamily)